MSQFLSKEGLDKLWAKIGEDQKKQDETLQAKIDANTNMIFAIHATDSISGGTYVEAGVSTPRTITAKGEVSTSPATPASYLGIFDGTTALKEGTDVSSISVSSTFTISSYGGTKSFTGKFKFLNDSIVRTDKTTTFTGALYSYYFVATDTLPTEATIEAGTKGSLMVTGGKFSGSKSFTFTSTNKYAWVAVPAGCTCSNGKNGSGFGFDMTLIGTVSVTNSGNVTSVYNLYRSGDQAAGTQTITF